MSRTMSDTEIRRRKKLQGTISRTTSTLGLGAAAAGTAALASRKPGALRAIQRLPAMSHVTPNKMKDAALTTGLLSGGIGGVGGYNFASYTGAEAKKKKRPAMVTKYSTGLDMGFYGEEGNQVKLPEIKVPIEKAWEPVASNYDSERGRAKRSKAYKNAALVTSGAGAGYGAHHGYKVLKGAGKLKSKTVAEAAAKVTGTHGRKAAAGAAVAGLGAGVNAAIKNRQKSSWQSYGKRDQTSAFGIDHAEWTAP